MRHGGTGWDMGGTMMRPARQGEQWLATKMTTKIAKRREKLWEKHAKNRDTNKEKKEQRAEKWQRAEANGQAHAIIVYLSWTS